MSKLITSPVKRFPGTVTLAEPLTFPMFFAWKQALEAAKEIITANGTQAEFDRAMLPGICACVEKWELENFPPMVRPETFPATKRRNSTTLIAWVIKEIGEVVMGEEEIPNA